MEDAEYERMARAASDHWWYPATQRLLAEVLAPHLARGARVLDVGCGTASAGGWLATRGPVVGVDASARALALHGRAQPATPLVRGLAQALPFRSGSFDGALCVTVLYHRWVDEPGAVVREIARVLRPGGVACLLEPGLAALRRAHDGPTFGARRFTRRELAALARQGGLAPLRASGAYTFLVPPAWLKAQLEGESTRSDLAGRDRGLGGLLPALAALERRWLRTHDLPTGLSALVLARKPGSTPPREPAANQG